MAKNIVFLELLNNLEELKDDVFFMSYTPLPIKGLDSWSIRVYAIEGYNFIRYTAHIHYPAHLCQPAETEALFFL